MKASLFYFKVKWNILGPKGSPYDWSRYDEVNPLSANPQNGQTHSNDYLTKADELFKCVWPFCGVGAERVKQHLHFTHFIPMLPFISLISRICWNWRRMLESIEIIKGIVGKWVKLFTTEIWLYREGHLFSTYAKVSEKLPFFTPWYAHIHLRGSSEHFADVLNERSLILLRTLFWITEKINPSHANFAFQYPLETIPGSIEMEHWPEMG